jgi:hypothetical protein
LEIQQQKEEELKKEQERAKSEKSKEDQDSEMVETQKGGPNYVANMIHNIGLAIEKGKQKTARKHLRELMRFLLSYFFPNLRYISELKTYNKVKKQTALSELSKVSKAWFIHAGNAKSR